MIVFCLEPIRKNLNWLLDFINVRSLSQRKSTRVHVPAAVEEINGLLVNVNVESIKLENVKMDNLQKRGTGARENAGKPAYELILSTFLMPVITGSTRYNSEELATLETLLVKLEAFALTNEITALEQAYETAVILLTANLPEETEYSPLDEVAGVFHYATSTGKYEKYNWMAGMSWSACLGCIHRHLVKVFYKQEALDPETGRHHLAHVICNIQMLLYYHSAYKEGNDLPSSLVEVAHDA